MFAIHSAFLYLVNSFSSNTSYISTTDSRISALCKFILYIYWISVKRTLYCENMHHGIIKMQNEIVVDDSMNNICLHMLNVDD